METCDDVTVRRDDVRAAVRLLDGPARGRRGAIWVAAGPEPGTVTLAYGEARHTIPAAGAWGTPAEIDAGCFFRLFRHGRLPESVRITAFAGTVMVAGTVIEPPWAPAAPGGPEAAPSPQGELFPPAVLRTLGAPLARPLAPPRRR